MPAYAAATATTASWEKLRDGATSGQSRKPARTTVTPYREGLERLYVLDVLPALTDPGERRSARYRGGGTTAIGAGRCAQVSEVDPANELDSAPPEGAEDRSGRVADGSGPGRSVLRRLVGLQERPFSSKDARWVPTTHTAHRADAAFLRRLLGAGRSIAGVLAAGPTTERFTPASQGRYARAAGQAGP